MLHPVELGRTYTPETIAVASDAFDAVCQSAPNRIGNEDMRETLASIILRQIDRGERDPVRLSDIALRQLAGMDVQQRG